MSLSAEQVAWVAHLARLELSPADRDQMARQLGAILDYVNQLQTVDTDHVEPLAHPHDLTNVFRADESTPSLPVEAALANCPDRDGDFFSVPAVFDQAAER